MRSASAILNRYPLPNVTQTKGTNYNYEIPSSAIPTTDDLIQQPAIRLDYQMSSKLRVTGKYSGQRARARSTPGLIQGFTDVLNPYPYITNYAATVNYTLNPTTFIEGTYGFIRNELAGGNENGVLVNESANRLSAAGGLANFPLLYPDAGVVDPRYYAYQVMQDLKPVFWDGTSINLPPVFAWGGRIGAAPPNQRYPGWLNINRTQDYRRQLDEGRRPPHDQGRLLQQPQLQGAEHRRRRPGEPELPGLRQLRQRHEQPARHAASAMPTPRWACSRSTSRPRSSSKAA